MTDFRLNKGLFLDPRSVPDSAWIGHIPLAGWIVEAAQPRLLVELGTHWGASYFAFCQAVQEAGLDTRCYAVDTWRGDEHAGEYSDDVFNAVASHHREHYEGFSKLMRMTFDEARTYFDDGSVDLLHIDGLHTYDAVRHDFETWLPKMSSQGVILFHDTNVRERDFGVWKLWAELRDVHPSFEFSHTHGLGVLLVGESPPEELQAFIRAAVVARADEINRLFERLGLLISTRQRLDALARRHAHLEGDNGYVRGTLAEREAVLGQAQSATTELRAQLDQHRSRAMQLETDLEQIRATLDKREDELAQARHELSGRDAELSESRLALDKIDAALAAATAGLAREMAARERMQAEHMVLSECLAGTEAEKAVLESRVACIENEAARIASDLSATRAELYEIVGSATWRMTAPVRSLVGLLRGVRSGAGKGK